DFRIEVPGAGDRARFRERQRRVKGGEQFVETCGHRRLLSPTIFLDSRRLGNAAFTVVCHCRKMWGRKINACVRTRYSRCLAFIFLPYIFLLVGDASRKIRLLHSASSQIIDVGLPPRFPPGSRFFSPSQRDLIMIRFAWLVGVLALTAQPILAQTKD